MIQYIALLCLLIQPAILFGMELKSKGFIELENQQALKKDYDDLYNSFDKMIQDIKDNTELFEFLNNTEKEFLTDTVQKERYCSAPPSYRDPEIHTQKRHNKIYFQYVKEYFDLLKGKHTEMLNKYPNVNIFLSNMDKIDSMAKALFAPIIEELSASYPTIKDRLYGKHKELSIISKIVRYKKGKDTQWGTTAHFDKSALTLIWDSNDNNHESLVICPDNQHPSMNNLIRPERKYADSQTTSSTMLIVGSALKKDGIDLKPTLHGVHPLKQDYRHAVISFALIPDIDMSDLKTDYDEFN